MDLIVRTALFALVFVLIVAILYYSLQGTFSSVSQQQAQSTVLSYLARAYPNAVVNVSSEVPSNYTGSWHIVTAVVLNSTTPCPSYYIYSFDYPKFGFVYHVDNIYTNNNCQIPGFSSNNIVSSGPVAMTRSYALNISSVKSYVGRYGFGNVHVSAHFFNNAALSGKNYTNVWVINYSSSSSVYNVYVLMSQMNGNALLTYNSSH